MIAKPHIPCLAVLVLTSALAAEMPVQAARQYTTAHQAKLTQEFSEFLSIPNVAADPANLKRNADLLVEMLKNRGVESRLLSIRKIVRQPLMYLPPRMSVPCSLPA
jgi:hypothetical protein